MQISSTKILTDAKALSFLIRRLKFQGRRIVFTNGCFDLLHYGHVDYLEKARNLGEVLIVGVNTDASIQRLKGPERPIQSEQARLQVLAALSCVSYVIPFEEDTPLELIKKIQPDILVKGEDYTPEQIVGYSEVKARGGQVMTLPLVEGYSTTGLITKIRAL